MVARCHEGMEGRTSPLSSMSATWSVVTKSMSFTSPCRYDSLSVLTGAHLAMIRVAKHFLSGFLLPLTGGRMLLRHRSLLGVALAPLVLNSEAASAAKSKSKLGARPAAFDFAGYAQAERERQTASEEVYESFVV